MSGGTKRRRVQEEEPEEHVNHERWMVSYSDMMTLLMVLFIVMFAISQVDVQKFEALRVGLATGFGAPLGAQDGAEGMLESGSQIGKEPPPLGAGHEGGNGEAKVNPDKVAELANATSKAQVKVEVENLRKAKQQLQKALVRSGKANGATFRFNEQGLVVTIATDKVLFDSGRAVLLPGGRKILTALAPTLRALPNRLSVDGHTDPHPISTVAFPSNWELSTARATGVLRYLHAVHRIPFARMVATGYADTRPLRTGRSARDDTANRRVEIIVVARVDNSLGRAVESLGNAPTPAATPAPVPARTPVPAPAATSGTGTGGRPAPSTGSSPRTSGGPGLGFDLPKIDSPF
jgi:chemotaxis protein MotB